MSQTALLACAASACASRLELLDQELDAFDRHGFHLHEPLFSPAEVAALAEAGERVAQRVYATGTPPDQRCWEPGFAATAMVKYDNGWKSDPVLRAAATDARIGRIAAQLIGADGMRVWHDQYLRKPADGGFTVDWHQDWAHWPAIDRPRTITCWIALQDVAADMGPMLFLAGSHRAGARVSSIDVPGSWTGDALMPAPLAGHDVVPALIPAGAVSFHHGLTVHASGRNRSARDRVAFVTHLVADDCCWAAGHDAPGEPPRTGTRLRGERHPYAWRSRG